MYWDSYSEMNIWIDSVKTTFMLKDKGEYQSTTMYRVTKQCFENPVRYTLTRLHWWALMPQAWLIARKPVWTRHHVHQKYIFSQIHLMYLISLRQSRRWLYTLREDMGSIRKINSGYIKHLERHVVCPVSQLFIDWDTWIHNHTHHKMWDEITYPFPNFNERAVEVCDK